MNVRVLVMNGQRIVQVEDSGKWSAIKVGKAVLLRPAVYDLSKATTPPSHGQIFRGPIVHADDSWVYQDVDGKLLKHHCERFANMPLPGTQAVVTYRTPHAE